MSNIQATLNEREKTHGDYANTARIIQDLKHVVRRELVLRQQRGQSPLLYTQLETIEMIMHKVGRIISGDNNAVDHYHDIACYATLCANELRPTASVEEAA